MQPCRPASAELKLATCGLTLPSLAVFTILACTNEPNHAGGPDASLGVAVVTTGLGLGHSGLESSGTVRGW
jgi:hypothetical protein